MPKLVSNLITVFATVIAVAAVFGAGYWVSRSPMMIRANDAQIDEAIRSRVEAEAHRDGEEAKAELQAAQASVQAEKASIQASIAESSRKEAEEEAMKTSEESADSSDETEENGEDASPEAAAETDSQGNSAQNQENAPQKPAGSSTTASQGSGTKEDGASGSQGNASTDTENNASSDSEGVTEAPETTVAETKPAPPAPTGPTVLIGDSRTAGFSAFGAWPASQVFYTYSAVNVSGHLVTQAASLQPGIAVFFHGVDDLISFAPVYAIRHYENYINNFRALSPKTRIYVHAVLPVSEAAVQKKAGLAGIASYNAYIADMCARNGWTYIDCSQGFSMSVLASDGIHFGSAWTRTWLGNIRSTVGF